MPLTPRRDLPTNPAVRIFFTGQLILEPSADNKTCEVFVNRSAADHNLSIEVRRKRPNLPDVIVMRHLGALSFAHETGEPSRHGMFIRVSKSTDGVQRYTGEAASTEGKSLDQALNLKRLHAVPTGEVSPSGGRPSILLENAVFYTADQTPMDLEMNLKKRKTGTLLQRLPPIANIIGANIYLKGDSVVTLTWRQLGRLINLNLDFRNAEAGATYEIYISNDPLYEDDGGGRPAVHDEFEEYYKVLPEIHFEEQLKMEFPKERPDMPRGNRGSSRTPCMSVFLND